VNLRNTEKLIGKKIFVNKEHPFHTDNLVEQKEIPIINLFLQDLQMLEITITAIKEM
jgi:hypothetical protein